MYWTETDDRTEQVNQLRQFAADLAETTPPEETSAEQVVAFWLDEIGVDLPTWFDNYDRTQVIEFLQTFLDEE